MKEKLIFFLGCISVMCNVENLRQVRLSTCLFIWIFVLVFLGSGLCSDSLSFSSEVGFSDRNVDPKNSNYSYIMKSYYKKYGKLDDLDYKDFIVKEHRLGLCDIQSDNFNLVPRLLVLERKLIGEGSHRHISSSIKIRLGIKPIAKLSQYDCRVIVIERLPLGVFADPFELQHLPQCGVFYDIDVFGDTNLESPSFLSNRSVVEIHVNVDLDILRHKREVDINLKVPLHTRYAPLNEIGYSLVRFDAPDLFVRCSVEEDLQAQSCLYEVKADNGDELRYGEMVWKIPSGIKAHSGIVYLFTFVSASLAALLIVLTSICHSSVGKCKSLKKS